MQIENFESLRKKMVREIFFGLFAGGALLQKVNRDTYKFAQKTSANLVNGEWVGIAKDPITDPGKKSKEGIITLR